MEWIFIVAAFASGFIALRCGLPPLVGFLVAGFGLHYAGYQSTPTLNLLADLGVTLLLFTIGLKLDIKTLLAKEIWAGATIHNLLTTAAFTLALIFFKAIGIDAFAGFDITQLTLVAFALSFSSTVFAIKALQEKGELGSTYGTLAIGVLIMQDIFAVIFLTVSTGKIPEIYALALFALPLLRPALHKLLDGAGHGEMLVLYAVFLALIFGAGLFGFVGVKADLGALIAGMLMAGHPKASEMAKSLFNLKELFLICFFLNIGLAEAPTMNGVVIGLLLILLLPIKGVLYYAIFHGFRFRVRTALLATLTLFNYSEFGLIVAGLAYSLGLLPGSMLVAMAVVVSLSFLLAAPLNTFSQSLYGTLGGKLKEHASNQLNPSDQLISLGDARILILGMGRIGSGAYDELTHRLDTPVLGIEAREESVSRHKDEGRNVIHGDATDPDFWARLMSRKQIEVVLLAMPNSQANIIAMEEIREMGFDGKVAAITRYADEVDQLKELGVDEAFNIYNEAGSGFAQHVCARILEKPPSSQSAA